MQTQKISLLFGLYGAIAVITGILAMRSLGVMYAGDSAGGNGFLWFYSGLLLIAVVISSVVSAFTARKSSSVVPESVLLLLAALAVVLLGTAYSFHSKTDGYLFFFLSVYATGMLAVAVIIRSSFKHIYHQIRLGKILTSIGAGFTLSAVFVYVGFSPVVLAVLLLAACMSAVILSFRITLPVRAQ